MPAASSKQDPSITQPIGCSAQRNRSERPCDLKGSRLEISLAHSIQANGAVTPLLVAGRTPTAQMLCLFTMSNTRARRSIEQASTNFHDQPDQDQPAGGARRDRTDDLMLAKHALSQLSYGPVQSGRNGLAAEPPRW